MSMDNSDDQAEMDQFREALLAANNVVTSDPGGTTSPAVVEYICGEGDPPFIKYRLTLESISEHSAQEFDAIEERVLEEKKAKEAEAAE